MAAGSCNAAGPAKSRAMSSAANAQLTTRAFIAMEQFLALSFSKPTFFQARCFSFFFFSLLLPALTPQFWFSASQLLREGAPLRGCFGLRKMVASLSTSQNNQLRNDHFISICS